MKLLARYEWSIQRRRRRRSVSDRLSHNVL